MSIELPKDAKGREIPLDTECLYTYKGEKQDVFSFTYHRRKDIWEIETDMRTVNSIYLSLTPPDSWKRLEEDLDRCIAENNACVYSSTDGTCQNCGIHGTSGPCTPKMFKDIKERIRKLRDEG